MAVFKGSLLITILLLAKPSWSAPSARKGGKACRYEESPEYSIEKKGLVKQEQALCKDELYYEEDELTCCAESVLKDTTQYELDQNYKSEYERQENANSLGLDHSYTDIDQNLVTIADSDEKTSKSSGAGLVCKYNWYNCKETTDTKIICSGCKDYNKYCYKSKNESDYDTFYEAAVYDYDEQKLSVDQANYMAAEGANEECSSQQKLYEEYMDSSKMSEESKSKDFKLDSIHMGQENRNMLCKDMDIYNKCDDPCNVVEVYYLGGDAGKCDCTDVKVCISDCAIDCSEGGGGCDGGYVGGCDSGCDCTDVKVCISDCAIDCSEGGGECDGCGGCGC